MMSNLDKQWKLIAGVVVGLLIIAGAVVASKTFSANKEMKAQEDFFRIEKKYTDYKTKKEKPADLKDPKAIQPTPEALATERATLKKDLESFIAGKGQSTAAQMAALYYSEILREEKNNEQALATLQKVQNKDTGLVNTLVQQQIGQLLANSDKCKEAIDQWQMIVTRKEAEFLHNEVKIQQALCYQKLNDMKKAEELLTNIANQKTDGQINSTSIKDAAKYLRLLQMKKVGTSS